MSISYLPLYSVWTQSAPVIPKLYWGVYSQEERILHLCEEIGKIVDYMDTIGAEINATKDEIAELAKELSDFYNTFADDFEQYYRDRIEEWLSDHMEDYVASILKFVWFGLTDDGYFVAYVPEQWDDLTFDTGYDFSDTDTYGHLILEYD